jgi:hypothetical protein
VPQRERGDTTSRRGGLSFPSSCGRAVFFSCCSVALPAPPSSSSSSSSEKGLFVSPSAAKMASEDGISTLVRAALFQQRGLAAAAAAAAAASAPVPAPGTIGAMNGTSEAGERSDKFEGDVVDMSVCGHKNRDGRACMRRGYCPYHDSMSKVGVRIRLLSPLCGATNKYGRPCKRRGDCPHHGSRAVSSNSDSATPADSAPEVSTPRSSDGGVAKRKDPLPVTTTSSPSVPRDVARAIDAALRQSSSESLAPQRARSKAPKAPLPHADDVMPVGFQPLLASASRDQNTALEALLSSQSIMMPLPSIAQASLSQGGGGLPPLADDQIRALLPSFVSGKHVVLPATPGMLFTTEGVPNVHSGACDRCMPQFMGLP